MEKEKVLDLVYLKDILENSYSEDSGTFAIAVKVLELLKDAAFRM